MPSPSAARPNTAEDVLAIIKAMNIEERKRLFKALDQAPTLICDSGYAVLSKRILDLVLESHRTLTQASKMFLDFTDAENKRRSRPVKNAERDEAIVHLRDQKKISFGRMGRELVSLNPAWTGKNGKPLTRAAAEKAYHRRKSNTA
jgi:hypothetical protein